MHCLPVLAWWIGQPNAGGSHARKPGCKLDWTSAEGSNGWIQPSSNMHASKRDRP